MFQTKQQTKSIYIYIYICKKYRAHMPSILANPIHRSAVPGKSIRTIRSLEAAAEADAEADADERSEASQTL